MHIHLHCLPAIIPINRLTSSRVLGTLLMCALMLGTVASAKITGEKVDDPFVVPVRAVILAVDGKNLSVGPGSDGGMQPGMEFRIFRGRNPKGTSQWVGKCKAVEVDKRSATLELTEGEAQVTDYAISAPVSLGQQIIMPKADRTTRPASPMPGMKAIEVKLHANVENAGQEIVGFGVPFPPNAIPDDSQVAAFQGNTELPVATKVLAPWRIDAKNGSPRSVLVQFPLDFTGKTEQTVTIRWDKPRTRKLDQLTPITNLLVFKTIESTTQYEGNKNPAPVTLRYEEPRVLAVLPAEWLCESWIVGPQVPTADDKWLPDFEQQWMTLFTPQTKSTLSSNFAEQQLDRTITYYKMYVRTGQPHSALESYRIATFYRNCIYTAEQTKRGRGSLSLKHSLESANGKGWLDIKYAYAEGLAAHYLLTGDARCLGTIEDICAFFDSDFGSFIRNNYSKKPRVWTERFAAFTLLSKLHAYQVTGREQYLADAKQQIDNVRDMQLSPPDQMNDRSPALHQHPDGSWRHSSEHHADGEGYGSSIWMSTYLIDGIFQYWLLTGDARCPDMLANYAEYAERYGINWFSWADDSPAQKGPPRWPQPYYWASSTSGGYVENGDEADHNIETGYLFLMGYYFRSDPRYLAIGTQLIRRQTTRMHPRQFNWVYRASPQAIWFLKAAGVGPEDLSKFSKDSSKPAANEGKGASAPAPRPVRKSNTMLQEINPPPHADTNASFVIRGAKLIDGRGGPSLPNSTVMVRGSKIVVAAGPGAALTLFRENPTVVDATGMTLLPGLIDAHFHIEEDYELPRLYLSHGVTSLRDPGVPIKRYDPICQSTLPQPRCFMAGLHLDCPPVAHPQDSIVVTNAAETRRAVNQFIDEGASVIKVYYRLPLDLIKVACDTAHQRGVPVTAHLELIDADAAIRAGLDGIEHITSFGTALAEPGEAARFRDAVSANNRARGPGRYQLWSTLDLERSSRVKPLLDLIVQRKVVVSPTLAVFEKRRGDANTTEVEARGYENMLRFMRLCHRAGAIIAVGSHSDVPKAERGWAFQREMELLVECGLTPGEAITAATRNNAAFFRVSDRLGTIEPGKFADLILVRGDPLADIRALRQVQRVMLNGQWIEPSEKILTPAKGQPQ